MCIYILVYMFVCVYQSVIVSYHSPLSHFSASGMALALFDPLSHGTFAILEGVLAHRSSGRLLLPLLRWWLHSLLPT